jgi:hypothetical protein
VLITDAPPGGFQDVTHVNHAHQYALDAAAQCIKINAIQVQPEDGTTTTVMTDYYQTTCGWYSLIPKSDGNAVGAILKMLYEPGLDRNAQTHRSCSALSVVLPFDVVTVELWFQNCLK